MIGTLSHLAYFARTLVPRNAFAVTAILLLLGACSLPRDDSFSSDDKYDSSSDLGMVVLGLRSTSDNGHDLYVYWWPIDPETNRFIGMEDQARVVRRFVYDGTSTTEIEYKFFLAPAGKYGLSKIRIETVDVFNTITFRPTTAAFELKAGEIVYVGNFTLFIDEKTYPVFGIKAANAEGAKLRPDGRNDEEAQAAVDKHSGISGIVRHQTLEQVRVE